MRVHRIKIDRWRQFANVDIVPPSEAPIVCLVGGNGTGKSQILELIAACARRIGISAGFENSRGDPFQEGADFELTFHIAEGAIANLDNTDDLNELNLMFYNSWDRKFTVKSNGIIKVGGFEGDESGFANLLIEKIRSSADIHYLALDADRSYPKIVIQEHQIGSAYSKDWVGTSKDSAYKTSKSLYDEWFHYMLGTENDQAEKFTTSIRLARDNGTSDPVFDDKFESYKNNLRKVLPHLLFVGIKTKERDVKFDTAGIDLSFAKLSSGEREIAFLVGQIERFGLKRGLLLVDEPELHLNYELLRTWIGYLKDSVELGQIWLATHALEVVEVAGQDATIVLERDETTRKVNSAVSLKELPVAAALSRNIGSPAFSIGNLVFVYIEGTDEIGERERFRLMCEPGKHVRFIEGGSCGEVAVRLQILKKLAEESGQHLRLTGIIDRDWREAAQVDELIKDGLFVLDVHEIENFYLHPDSIARLVSQIGGVPAVIHREIEKVIDKRAGHWIFASARSHKRFREMAPPSKQVREFVDQLAWERFVRQEELCQEIAAMHGNLNAAETAAFSKHMEIRKKIFERKRSEDGFWKDCEGKEVFRAIVKPLGFADSDAAERAFTALWRDQPSLVPEGLQKLKAYIAAL